MLRVSKLTDYGTLVLTHMAGFPERLFSVADLAQVLHLNAPTISKVLKALGRHELVTSVRGARGGYALARPAGEISVAQIIDALEDQPFGLTECSATAGTCDIEGDCRIRANWQRINTVVRRVLDDVSLADMVQPMPLASEATMVRRALPNRKCSPQ
ncbi:MAG: SUF system Fe-S cluster assembly regulator [Rhodocyclaceae bacterium]